MTTKARFKSDAFGAIHSAARGLNRAGTIDEATLRDFDETCLAAPVAIAPEDIKQSRARPKIRDTEGVEEGDRRSNRLRNPS